MFKYLLYFSLLSPFSGVSQQQIKGVFSPASEFKATMLYQLSAGNATYVSYGSVNADGEMQIDLGASVTAGLYKLVYALPQSEHNFEFIYTGTEAVEFNFDAETGVEFIKSKENQLLHAYTQSMAVAQNELVQLYAEPSMDSLIYMRRAQKMDSLQNSYEALSKGTIAAHFITASSPYIPTTVETANSYISNVKTHYFDAINFQEAVLQSSNFIVDKTLEYILRMHFSATPSFQEYQANIDAVNNALAGTDLSYQLTTLNTLREALITSEHNALAVYLTKTYVLLLAKQLNDTKLITSLDAFMRIAVGEKASNFQIENPLDSSEKTLYDLEGATTYLLIFWSSDCTHCLKELPEVHNYISSHPEKNIAVVAIGIESDPKQWTETIAPWSGFTHSIAEGKWAHDITKSYDIKATPTYFILDASKVITAKPYSLNDLKMVLDQK
jgi:thiol-disulfide isomerase/thioredoxin|tara:strand:+ start:564 stop:1889 length:1326 start_codon:yes stop_codon:yes gene_type:complete